MSTELASVSVALRADPEVPRKLAEVLLAGLEATTWRWDKATGKVVTEPDYKERREYARLILSYCEGLPRQTIINVDALAGDRPVLAEILRRSPNARRAVEAFLARIDDVTPAVRDQQTEGAG